MVIEKYQVPHLHREFVKIAILLFTILSQHLPSIASLGTDGFYAELDDGIQIVYQIPNNATNLAGVLIVAHGCSHSATDWWRKSNTCPTCIGLPLEQSIVKMAVQKNMAVMAISSIDRVNKCWVYKHDRMRVIKAIRYIYTKVPSSQEGRKLPLYLFGVSSGGSFVGTFAQDAKSAHLQVSAICVQVMFVRIHRESAAMVPTIFVHMPLDAQTAQMISNVVLQMNQRSPNSAVEMRCEKKELTSTYFFEHNAALNREDSAKFVLALASAGYLSINNTLIRDPRGTEWREVSISVYQIEPKYSTLA